MLLKKSKKEGKKVEKKEHRVTPSPVLSLSPEKSTVNRLCVSFQVFPMYLQSYIFFILLHKWDSYCARPSLACFLSLPAT